MKRLLLYSAFLLSLSSCLKDEIPISYEAPVLSAGTFSNQIEMGADYNYRLYYDIESDSVVAMHSKVDWDIALACHGEPHIRINDSRLMSVWKVTGASWDEVTGIQGDGPHYDSSDGLELAIDVLDADIIYILDLGFDSQGAPQGRVKLSATVNTEGDYQLQYSPLEASESLVATVSPDETKNYVMFDMGEGVKDIEPNREDWDLLFTHYTFYFNNEELPYLVSGALLNPHLVEAKRLAETDFEQIDVPYVESIQLSPLRDAIGYDWKLFDLDAQVYIILENAYAIETVEGNTYKMQFSGFLNADGERGAPAFDLSFLY